MMNNIIYNLYNRFKLMSFRVRAVVIAVLVALIAIVSTSIIIIVTNHQEEQKLARDSAGLSTLTVDENSGETIMQGQVYPEIEEVPGAPVIYGIANLMDRGLTYDETILAKSIIQGKYAESNNSTHDENKRILTASIAKAENIDHYIEESGLNVYNAKFVLNSDQDNILQIKTNGNNMFQLYIGKDINHLELVYTSK